MDDRRGRRPGPRPKGICPACGQLRHLRDSGVMGMHHRLARGRYNIGVCPGVDQPALIEGPEMPEPTSTNVAPEPKYGMASRPVDLRADSLLWLINRTVFHPRGYALALDTDSGAFSLVGDGDEPFVFPGDGHDERFHLAKIKELMP